MGVGLMIAGGGLNFASSYMNSAISANQQQQQLYTQASQAAQASQQSAYDAEVARLNAQSALQDAKLEEYKASVEQLRLQTEKEQVRKGYNQEKGRNVSTMASANIDLSSGSALDLLQGNANEFAEDMGTQKYNQILADWEAEQAVNNYIYQSKQLESSANMLDIDAEYLSGMSSVYSSMASNTKASLFASLLNGAGGALSNYRG